MGADDRFRKPKPREEKDEDDLWEEWEASGYLEEIDEQILNRPADSISGEIFSINIDTVAKQLDPVIEEIGNTQENLEHLSGSARRHASRMFMDTSSLRQVYEELLDARNMAANQFENILRTVEGLVPKGYVLYCDHPRQYWRTVDRTIDREHDEIYEITGCILCGEVIG